jgi:hypothetical protein
MAKFGSIFHTAFDCELNHSYHLMCYKTLKYISIYMPLNLFQEIYYLGHKTQKDKKNLYVGIDNQKCVIYRKQRKHKIQ